MSPEYLKAIVLSILLSSTGRVSWGQTLALAVSSATANTGQSVPVDLVLSGSSAAGMQWSLNYSPSDFTAVQVSAGSSATGAGKTLACNNVAGSSRCVLYGVNSNAMAGGTVATYTFAVAPSTAGTPASRLSLVQLSGSGAASLTGTAVTTTASDGVVTILKSQITVTPSNLSMSALQSQPFIASATATWSINPAVGSITAGGVYTAPSIVPSLQTVSIKATSALDPAVTATATVTLTPVTIAVSPATARLDSSQTKQFTATVTDTSSTAVNWSLNPAVGSITVGGFYTAPASITALQAVAAKATSVADPSKSATATVTLAPPPANVSITPSAGSAFSQTFSIVYSDMAGYADIGHADVLFRSQLAGQNACWVQYSRPNNLLLLVSDSGVGFAGSTPIGAPGTLNNQQCTLDAGASSVSASGTNLTVTLALTFKPAFTGQKNIYMSAVDIVGGSSGWEIKGTWTPPVTPATNVSVTPASGTGTTRNFSFAYSDPSGYTDITYVDMLIHSQIAGQNACFVQYAPAANLVWLISDSGSAYIGPATLGVAGTLTNSQCTVDAGASLVSGSGINLTVNLALAFKPAFGGTKNIYMGVVNAGTVFSGWQMKGSWTIPGTPPTVISVTPASGSGSAQAFTLAYSDPNGYMDINYVSALFQSQLSAQNACWVQYSRDSNLILLIADSGSGFAGSAAPGTAGALTNSQCTVDTGASSVSVSGNNLTLVASVTFKPVFGGLKNVWTGAVSNSGSFSGWQNKGSWSTPASPPANVSVSPSSGAGTAQIFTAAYSDIYGYTDINYVSVLFQGQLAGDHACWVQYSRTSNLILLVTDSGTGFVGSVAPGTAGTLTNSQCALDTGSFLVSGSGNNLTLTFALSFKPAFAGAKNVYMSAVNSDFSGWQTKGGWTVP